MALKFSFILVLLASALLVESSIIPDSQFDIAAFTGAARGTGGLQTDRQTCNGLVGECLDAEEELMIDSDIARRSLAYGGIKRDRYISYAAMRKNNVPCGRKGVSYYTCGRASQANPYRRGCSKITHCWRNLN